MMSKRRHSSGKENEEREPYYEKKSRFETLNDKLLEERNRNRDEIEGLQNELNEMCPCVSISYFIRNFLSAVQVL